MRITDEQLLQLIIDGTLHIKEIDSEHPILYCRGKPLRPYLNRQGGKHTITGNGSSRYRWSIRWNGRQRKVMCSKLVFMYWHRRLVQPGCKVHHGSKGRLWDGISNLEEMSEEQHKEFHYGASYNRAV